MSTGNASTVHTSHMCMSALRVRWLATAAAKIPPRPFSPLGLGAVCVPTFIVIVLPRENPEAHVGLASGARNEQLPPTSGAGFDTSSHDHPQNAHLLIYHSREEITRKCVCDCMCVCVCISVCVCASERGLWGGRHWRRPQAVYTALELCSAPRPHSRGRDGESIVQICVAILLENIKVVPHWVCACAATAKCMNGIWYWCEVNYVIAYMEIVCECRVCVGVCVTPSKSRPGGSVFWVSVWSRCWPDAGHWIPFIACVRHCRNERQRVVVYYNIGDILILYNIRAGL